MTGIEFEKLLHRYSEGKCSEKEIGQVNQWFEEIDSKPDESLNEQEKLMMEARIMKNIERSIDRSIEDKVRNTPFGDRINLFLIYGGIAASLLLAILSIRYQWDSMSTVVSNKTLTAIRTIAEADMLHTRIPVFSLFTNIPLNLFFIKP